MPTRHQSIFFREKIKNEKFMNRVFLFVCMKNRKKIVELEMENGKVS